MRHKVALAALMCSVVAVVAGAQGLDDGPVFQVRLLADRTPLVAGEDARLAVVVDIASGWHVNSDSPGDEFSLPTEVDFELPAGWFEPVVSFPGGTSLEFDFAEAPIEVWEGEVVIVASVTVPEDAVGEHRLRVSVTAQACNDSQCLAPEEVRAGVDVSVAAPESDSELINAAVFEGASTADSEAGGAAGLEGKSLPLLLIGVFLAGLALNLTPCVFPLIPITVGFFSQQTKDGKRSTFPLALAYVFGIAVTYSVLGVLAALSGALFGGALQSPLVVGVIVVVLLALATSMFGLWELRVPSWAQRASGGRSGVIGALVMGLVMGFVAAPCVGPFVVGLLTYVGQRGDPLFGFVLFFTLAAGLGLPYLILGTFTGAVNRLPTSGMWMVGVRRVFGVILIAMAAYFAAPLMPGDSGAWLMSAVLIVGALYLLVIDRTGHEQATIDRVMRVLSAAMLVVGVVMSPIVERAGTAAGGDPSGVLTWDSFEATAVATARASGDPVILDFYADWCAPCKELEVKTFADPEVRDVLADYARFKIDLTRPSEAGQALTAEYDVLGVPTVIVFEGGSEAFRITGFEPPERFLERLRTVR
jgi:thiol:disulfide interchange protein DsbD